MSFHIVSSCRVGAPVCTHVCEKMLQSEDPGVPLVPHLSDSVLCPILTPQVASAQMSVLLRALWAA